MPLWFLRVMFQLLAEGGLDGQAIAEASDAQTMLLIGSLANELTRPAQIREQLGKQAPSEETPKLLENLDIYATRDSEQRYRLALNWVLDGVSGRKVEI